MKMKIQPLLITILITLMLLSSVISVSAQDNLSGEITVWSWDVAYKSLKVAAENFEKLHPDTNITLQELTVSDLYDKMAVSLLTGVGLPDVVSAEGNYYRTFVRKFPNDFVDLTELIEPVREDFLASKIDEATIDGKIMAFPWDTGPVGLYYRQDIFENAGVKADEIDTWDDFIEAGKKVVASTDGKVKMIGIDKKSGDATYNMLSRQLTDTAYFNETGEPIVNSKESILVMNKIKQMNDAGIIYNVDGWGGRVQASANSLIATLPYAVWWAGTLQEQAAELTGKWRVMELPRFKEGGDRYSSRGGSGLMLTSGSDNLELAKAFTKFAMTDVESLMIGFNKYGLYPSYKPCYDEPDFNQGVEYFGGQKIWKFFSDISTKMPKVKFTQYNSEVWPLFESAKAKILLEKQKVEPTMEELQLEVEKMIND